MIFENKIKRTGIWNLVDATELDDCAYYLLCAYVVGMNNAKPITQSTFNGVVIKQKNHRLEKYYNEALNILRSEKIERIKKRIDVVRR